MAKAAKTTTSMVGKDRIARLRQRVLIPPAMCIERGKLITDAYKETEDQPAVIRRAKALEKILSGMTIGIDDDELIVGKATSKRRGGALLPEIQWNWYLDEMDLISTREWDRLAPLSEEEKSQLREYLPYWKGKSLYEKWLNLIPEDVLQLHHVVSEGSAYCANGTHFAHANPDYEMVIEKGLNYVKKQAEGEMTKLDLTAFGDHDKYLFLKSVIMTMDAAIHFAKRHADLAKSMAKKETDPQRKAELEMIAETCSWVPANPARSYFEAMQAAWFVYVIVMIEGWGNGVGLGRPDQYLYPLYKKDISAGKITPDDARDIISLLYIKLNGLVTLQASQAVKSYCGFAIWANIALGGLTREGRDAVNDLSYLFLDAEDEVRLSAEDIIIRVHKNTPDAFLMRACDTLKDLRGKFKFVSDEVAMQQLLSDGKPIEYARDYILAGCNSPSVCGRSHDIPGALTNLPLLLELALNNGASRLNGNQIGPKTGNPKTFKSYDDVWNAYTKQVESALPKIFLMKNMDKKLFAEFAQTPFQSGVVTGCVEKAKDITDGGTAPYMTRAISLAGAPNVGDSLAAVKRVIFEDKKFTMSQLIDALDKNFEGEDKMLYVLSQAPKFGNDDDYVDNIVNQVLTHGSAQAYKNSGAIPGALSNVAAAVVTANVPLGTLVGALPDGRKAGMPLSEGGISPYQGRNISGPTATMRSVAKLDHAKITNGSVLNMRFNPDVLKDQSKTRKFAALVRTFCETGGFLIQFNIVDSGTLRDAQAHPDRYRDLLVRVATYSAYFVELSRELQDDIISRIEFQEV